MYKNSQAELKQELPTYYTSTEVGVGGRGEGELNDFKFSN
jgi:hypothetical protein